MMGYDGSHIILNTLIQNDGSNILEPSYFLLPDIWSVEVCLCPQG